MFVFVYGTLKRGYSNHHWMGQAVYTDTAHTADQYVLYARTYPCMMRGPPTYHVEGEIYVIDDAILANLDILEGYPSLYTRDVIDVVRSSGERVKAWAYFCNEPEGNMLPEGRYLE